MARRRAGSGIEGILVVDKPAGPTSHDVVQQVRRAAGERRVGHTGTLDPVATGVLVVCLGRATRLVRFLQAGVKTYAARMVLGVETTTQDAAGDVVATAEASGIDERRFCEVLTGFRGVIEQIPPMVSAIRVGGERLHTLARRGEEIDRDPRQVEVHDLVLDRFVPGEHPEASFLVSCSAGTYVRTLAHDIGRALRVGGSLVSLRRIANGPFTADEAHDLGRVSAAGEAGTLPELLLSPTSALERLLPSVDIEDPDLARSLAQGGRLPAQDRAGAYLVRFEDRLVGVYADREGRGRAELVWTRPEELP